MRFSEVPLDDFEPNVLAFSHNPPSDAGVYWNIRQSGGWIWANSKTIVAGSGKSDRLLGIFFLRGALEGAVEGIGDGEKGGGLPGHHRRLRVAP
jgi:hypothetical protein